MNGMRNFPQSLIFIHVKGVLCLAKKEKDEGLTDTHKLIQDIIKDSNSSTKNEDFKIILDSEGSSVPGWIKTGSISLDKALGGGFPLGKIIELFGVESGGKSCVAESAAGECQKAGGIAIYIDTECAIIPNRAEQLGIEWDDLIFSQPSTIESVFEFIEFIINKVREHDSKRPVLIVWDSVAATPPKAELEGDYDQQSVGLAARSISKGFRKINKIIKNQEVCLVLINQIREKVGVMFGNPETTPGGRAIKFYSSIRLRISRKGIIQETKKDPALGIMAHVDCVKNKVAPPFRTADFNIMFDNNGIDKYEDLLTYGKSIGLFGESKGWYTLRGKKMRKIEAKIELKKSKELFKEYYEKVWNGELDDLVEEDKEGKADES